MATCARWTGIETNAFRIALRLKQEPFAEFVGVSLDTVKKWERRRETIALSSAYAARMDERLLAADAAVVQRFQSLLGTGAASQTPLAETPSSDFLDGDDSVVVSGRTLAGEIVLVSVPRRTFVTSVGAGAVWAVTAGGDAAMRKALAGKAFAGMFAGARIDHIKHFNSLRMSLIESDNVYGSARTLPHVVSALDLLDQLKRSKVADAETLLKMRAMFAETAAWQFQDQCDYASAQFWAARALQWSHQLADDYYIGLSLVRMSQLACDQGDADEAEELATAAHRSAPGDSLFAAASLTFRAHALALDHDRAGSARAYDQARRTVERAGQDPEWGMFLDDSYIDAHQAHTFAEIGEFTSATRQFEDAISRMQPGYLRDKGVYLARAAVAHMYAGEIEPAAALGTEALEIGVGTASARILRKVRQLSGMIDTGSTQAGVAEFRDAFATWKAQEWPDRM
ncbi:helix-turn-helix domain-containing protein [Nocardia sp. NPDC057668]|uniref:helix-turn-helix domain-containing protein n=1 Tax=Nocardia sp. NPDC057668 TaxID=3346202 RepID=UPI00366D5FB0